MALEALIFDVDGTLAETERDGHRVAFNQTFAAAGLDWHWSPELYGDLLQVAGGKERMQFYVDTYAPPVPVVPDWSGFLATLHREKTQHYTALLRSGEIALRPGIRRLILEARCLGIRLAIATTSHFDNAIALLETTLAPDAPQWFEVIAAGDIVPEKKPAPDIYQYVLTQLDLPPSRCLAIEDTEHGLQAAVGAGINTVITVNDYTQDQNFEQAALVLNHLGEPHDSCQVLQGEPLPLRYFDCKIAAQTLANC